MGNNRRNLGNCRCSAETFSALKREEEKEKEREKMHGVGRIALWLRVSGALASFCGSAQASRVTLAKVTSSLCSPLLHGFPFSSTTPSPSFSSACLTRRDRKLCEAQTASDFWFLSVWIWLFLDLICFCLYCIQQPQAEPMGDTVTKTKYTTEFLKASALKKKNLKMLKCFASDEPVVNFKKDWLIVTV